jgi:hypothetical protein
MRTPWPRAATADPQIRSQSQDSACCGNRYPIGLLDGEGLTMVDPFAHTPKQILVSP